MHRESRPQLRIASLCAYCESRERALEPADGHALPLGIAGHVECRRRADPSPLPERDLVLRGRLAYTALIASPLIELAASGVWSSLPGASLSTVAA